MQYTLMGGGVGGDMLALKIGGRLALKIGGRRTVKQLWKMRCWPPKQVGDGRLRPLPHPHL